MLHGITQCYLPPGRGDIPALTPAEAGTRLSDPGGMQENRIFFLLPEAFCGLKYAENATAAGAMPGPRWGSSRCSPRPLVGWGADTPPRLYDTSSHASEVHIDTSCHGREGCGGIGGGGCVQQRVRGGAACLALVNCKLYTISSYYTRLQFAYLSLYANIFMRPTMYIFFFSFFTSCFYLCT